MYREDFRKRANNNGQNVVPKQPASDVEEEMQRLVNGYKKHIGSSKIKSFMTEAFSLVKIPDWQKSKHWMVRNKIALCNRHFGSYAWVQKEWGTLGRYTRGDGGPLTGAPSPRKPPSSLSLFFLSILLPSTCCEGFRNGKTYLTYSNCERKIFYNEELHLMRP